MPRQHVRCPPDQRIVDGFARIREQLDVPPSFPPDVLDAAEAAVAAGPRIPAGAAPTVVDARDLDFVAVDPPGSTHHHQAIFAPRHRRG
ncbi:MAG: hypothetical protein AAGA90_23975 [Actinomycetota bacterium]